jgi:GT2 family glycosyltransferase
VTPEDVLVAVPCMNEAARAEALAVSLMALEPRPGGILALDDGSTDGTAQALRELGVPTILHRKNRGLGAARNTLWKRAQREGFSVVAYLDADVDAPTDHIARVVGLFDDDVAGVGGRNVDTEGGWVDAWRGRFWPQALGDERTDDASMLIGANAAYRVEALAAIGGFDEGHTSHGEDVDIGRRLRAAGHGLRYEPSLVVAHRRVDTPRDLVRSCYLHCREGMRATLRSPGEGATPNQLVFGMAAKAVRAPAAALVRRRDPREALLGAVACGAGLAGYAVGRLRS